MGPIISIICRTWTSRCVKCGGHALGNEPERDSSDVVGEGAGVESSGFDGGGGFRYDGYALEVVIP